MQRFKLTIEYDGRPFQGWQRQDNGPSVQQAIETAIFEITGETALVYGSGRTDSGVHALAQVAHVDIAKPLSAFRLSEALNARLRPLPVAILDARLATPDFHARFDAISRSYRYIIVNRRAPLTFDAGLAWQVAPMLDADAMNSAAQALVGQHDFTTFRAAQCQAQSPVKTLSEISVRRDGDRVIVETSARSFLHHQVRSMVGCLKLVGEGRWAEDDLRRALDAKDRNALGLNAPPDGLYFVAAAYV